MSWSIAYRWTDLPRLVGVALLYALLAKIALTFFSANGNVSILWLPSGLALAALLTGGKKYWPGIFAGALVGNSMAGASAWIAALIAAGNTMEALVAVWLLARMRHFDRELTQPTDYLRMIAAGAVSAVVAALNGVAVLLFSKLIMPQAVGANLLHWWQGDMLGIALLTPLILVWRKMPQGWLSQRRLPESIACFGLAFLFGQAIFFNWFHEFTGQMPVFWMFLFVAWAAVRFGRHGVMLIIGMTAAQGLMGEVLCVGFFKVLTGHNSMLNFWFYMLVLSLVGIVLALVIHSREQTESMVASSKALLDEAQRIAQIGSWDLDIGNGSLRWSDEIFRIFEIDQTKFGATYEAFLNAIHPDDRESVNKAYTDSVATRVPYDITHRLLMQDGRIKWVNERCETFYDEQGRPYHSVGTVQDITERKEIELHLRAVQDDLDGTLSAIPDLLFEVDIDGRYYAVHSPRTDLLAAPPEALLGKRVSDVMPPEAAAVCLDALQEAHERGYSMGRQFELELGREHKWFELSVARKGGEHADDSRFIVLSRNITERKQAEMSLQQSEEKLQSILNASAVAVAWANEQGVIEFINRTFTTMFGYTLADVPTVEQWYSRAYPDPAYREKIVSEWSAEMVRARSDKTTMNPMEVAVTCKDGTVKYVIVTGSWAGPLLLAIFNDITERKQAEAVLFEKESQYRVAVETAADGFWMMNARGHLIQVNDAYVRLSGYSREELLGMSISDLEAQEHPEETAAHISQVIHDGYARFESKHRKKDGSIWPVQIVTTFSPMAGGLFFAFIADLSERKKAEEALQIASMVYENSSEAMLVTDADNLIIAVNPAFEKMTGYTFDDVRGKNPRIFKSGRHDLAFYQNMWHKLLTEGHWSGELWDKRKNGEIHAKLLAINVIRKHDGAVFRHVALFTDITERKQFEELVWRQANFDSLTKLPNRRMFHDRLEQEAKKSHRMGLPMALMLIDLDRFKEVNDTLGHDQGDILLIEAAQRISQCVRESDTVARLGGDEFTVILSELDDMMSIERIAQNIIDRLSEPFKLGTENAYISASIGISLYPDDSTDLEALFKNADQSMYVAKNAGRNCFSYFTPALQEEAQKRLRLTNDLRVALASGQFRVYYQPIVELSSGQIRKAEALLRWQHPVRGMVGPMEFIPLAEETGLIIPIGEWVFKQVVQQVGQWRGTCSDSFQVSVNKSPAQLHHHGSTALSWPVYLQQQGVPGQNIVIEITEGLLLKMERNVNDKLLGFRDAGIQVAIDDFGTAYSSLSYLKKLDIDYLKIDQSFVHDLETDVDNLALCEAIIVMAHKLGLKVIAEGVETPGQRDLLVAAGCDYAQGYLFSKPLPPEKFEALPGIR